MGTIARWVLGQMGSYTKELAEKGELDKARLPPVNAHNRALFNTDQHGALLSGLKRENGFNFFDSKLGTTIFPLVQATGGACHLLLLQPSGKCGGGVRGGRRPGQPPLRKWVWPGDCENECREGRC